MREIKFRAWNTEKNKMDYHISFGGPLGYNLNNQPGFCNDPYSKLMQYTGLKDKNGREIYEGDIVTWGYGLAVVSMGTIKSGEYGDEDCTGWICEDCFLDKKCEVIGNIYENPELKECENV